jgi:hypothetical protein
MDRNRRYITVKKPYHDILKARKADTGISIEAQIDECLELAFKMKRLLPEEEREAAS